VGLSFHDSVHSLNEILATRMNTYKTVRMVRLMSVAGVLLMSYIPSLLACEGCKEPSNVAGDSGVGGISASFSWSVIFMLGVVAFLLTGMLFMIIRSCKELAAQQNPVAEAMPESTGRRVRFIVWRPLFALWRGGKMSPEIS
jgi:hypothetical protein